MRCAVFVLVLLIASCTGKIKKEKSLFETATGNWFVLYPDDKLLTSAQEKIYAEIQDSLTELKCLKLVSFSKDGVFNQLDSIKIKGRWGAKENEYLFINNGGHGFDDFRAAFSGYSNEVIRLTETVKVKGEKLKFIWHLFRIENGEANGLFDAGNNKWRQKPQEPEKEAEIKARVSQILNYYAMYFNLIADKSSYFIPGRIILPINLYQHAIGLKDFTTGSKFFSLFYSEEQARQAYDFLEKAIDEMKYGGTDTKSYAREYAGMLKAMVKVLER
jgi:hypothetical protein